MANVPSFQFSFRGKMRTYPRSGFRSGGTSECTLVPVLNVLGNIRQNHPSENHPLGNPRKNFMQKKLRQILIRQDKRAQTQAFGSGSFPVGWASSMCRGGAQKVRYVTPVCPSKHREPNVLAGYPRILSGYRGRQKSLRKKGLCSFFVPNICHYILEIIFELFCVIVP